jgi:hypothetical protein
MKRLLKELKKPTGVLELFDSLYEEINKDANIPAEEKLASFKDQISLYMGGPKAPRGSSRMVFPLNEKLVVKVALNEAGFVQNGMEATIGQDDSVADVVVPVESASRVIDHGGYLWIASKRVDPLSESAVGKDWAIFRQALIDASEKSGPIKPAYPVDYLAPTVGEPTGEPTVAVGKNKKQSEKKEVILQSEVYKNLPQGFFESFRNFTKRYRTAKTADLLKPDSWGMDGNTIKLIDYGYTSIISKDYYIKTGAGAIPAPSEEIKQRLSIRGEERLKNIEAKLSDNVDTISSITKPIPAGTTLPLVLKGIVMGLPIDIETFTVGNPIPVLTSTQAVAVKKAINSNKEKVRELISKISDASVQSRAQSEFKEIVGESRVRALIRSFVVESVLQYKGKRTL